MWGSRFLIVLLILLAQSNLVRERKAEYAHQSRAVLDFVEDEFWDPNGKGYLSNPYGKPMKLGHEQALVATAHFKLYNSTRHGTDLRRARDVMDYLSGYVSPEGGCYRLLNGTEGFYTWEQINTIQAYLEAYRNTGETKYERGYRNLTDFLIRNLTIPRENQRDVRTWIYNQSTEGPESRSPALYFRTAYTLFIAHKVDGNQSYLDAAKEILAASEKYWDQSNYGYIRGEDDPRRYCEDHALGAMAYLSAYDVTNRRDYLQRAKDIFFIIVSRMGDELSKTFYEAVSESGELVESERRNTVDHLLLVTGYLYAYQVTLEEKYLRRGQDVLNSVLRKAYDDESGAFKDQVGGGVMGDLEVQVIGAMTLIRAYQVLRVGPSPLLAILVIGVLLGLMAVVAFLFKTSWPY